MARPKGSRSVGGWMATGTDLKKAGVTPSQVDNGVTSEQKAKILAAVKNRKAGNAENTTSKAKVKREKTPEQKEAQKMRIRQQAIRKKERLFDKAAGYKDEINSLYKQIEEGKELVPINRKYSLNKKNTIEFHKAMEAKIKRIQAGENDQVKRVRMTKTRRNKLYERLNELEGTYYSLLAEGQIAYERAMKL